MPAKQKRKKIQLIAEIGDPEIDEIIRAVNQKVLDGTLKDPPRRKTDCKTLEDLCLHVCQAAKINGRNCIRRSKDRKIIKWTWFGKAFNDTQVGLTQDIVPRIFDKNDLKELWLESTLVSANGAEKLRRLFPKAKIRVFTEEDYHNGSIPNFHDGWTPDE